MTRRRRLVAMFVCALLVAAPAISQGAASCGFHLDVRCDGTSTHAAIGDMPNGPGSGGFPYPPGAPGNPYSAYLTPGTPAALIISGNSLAYGPAPLGPGSCVTIFYAFGAAMIPVPLAAPFVGTCTGAPAIIGILPIAGAVIDSCGFLGPPPPFGFFDAGSGRFIFTGSVPPFAPPGVSFQAAGVTPGGAIWVTNAVTIFFGPNPAELPVPPPIACGAFVPLDDGQSLGLPTPPGYTFYGFPAPAVDMETNGFVDFVPGVGPLIAGGCDITGTSADLGCAPASATARPRIDVNHADYDLSVVPAAPFVPGMTFEIRPPGPTWPDAVIYRWKNAPAFGAAAGIAGLSTAAIALELQGGACGGCIPPVVPNRIVVVRSWLLTVDQCGIGPGIAAQGYGGPPPALPTCSLGAGGLGFMTTFAPPFGLPFVGVPAGAIHMDTAAFSAAVFNSAVVFTPMGLPAPDAYILTVH